MTPLLSIITPANDDEMGTARTLSNIIYQKGRDVPREVLVVADGPTAWVRKLVRFANQKAKEAKQPCEFKYLHTPRFNGTGNIGRDLGLKQAIGDWVLFIDSGTVVMPHLCELIGYALENRPDTDLIVWDVIQVLDPAPVMTYCASMEEHINKPTIGYWIPGVGAATRRAIAQATPWPNVTASDWLYWGAVWKTLEKPVKMACIRTVCVVAYAASQNKRFRALLTAEDYENLGFNKPYEEAYQEHAYQPPPPEFLNGKSA